MSGLVTSYSNQNRQPSSVVATHRVTFLYKRPNFWFDLFNKVDKVCVALHHPTRHDKDLSATH